MFIQIFSVWFEWPLTLETLSLVTSQPELKLILPRSQRSSQRYIYKVSIKQSTQGSRPEGMYVGSKFSPSDFLIVIILRILKSYAHSHNIQIIIIFVPFHCQISLVWVLVGTEVQGSHSPLRLDQEKTETRMPGGLRNLPPRVFEEIAMLETFWSRCCSGSTAWSFSLQKSLAHNP